MDNKWKSEGGKDVKDLGKLYGHSNDLSRCPFCGCDYILIHLAYDTYGNLKGFCECRNCHAKSNEVWVDVTRHEGRSAALKECNEMIKGLWNRRNSYEN